MWHYRAPLSVIGVVHFSSSHCLICLDPAAALVTLHAPNNVRHRICRSCCSYLIQYNTPTCPACRSPVDLFEALGIPFVQNVISNMPYLTALIPTVSPALILLPSVNRAPTPSTTLPTPSVLLAVVPIPSLT